jgi:hypothetical protein
MRDAISLFIPSTDAVRKNVLAYGLLIVVPNLIITIGSSGDDNNPTSLMYLSGGIGGLISLLLYPAVIYMFLQASSGKAVNLKQAFTAEVYKKFWRLLGVTILIILLAVLGFIAFIIPGLIVLRRYVLSPFYIMDRDMGILESLAAAAKDSKRFSWAIYGVLAVEFGIGTLSILPLPFIILSSILTLLYATAPAIRYQEIKQALKD